jgi:hypothetical protein
MRAVSDEMLLTLSAAGAADDGAARISVAQGGPQAGGAVPVAVDGDAGRAILRTIGAQVAMLEWCSYCQRFMRESAPYENFAITHGCCPECVSQHDDLLARRAVQHGQFLRGIFQELLDAGRHSNFSAAMRTVEKAIAQNCRPVDILIGMIAPMLYEIGEEWKRGVLRVEGEHRFCDKIIGLVEKTIARSNAAPFVTRNARLLFLMNATGNRISSVYTSWHFGCMVTVQMSGSSRIMKLSVAS